MFFNPYYIIGLMSLFHAKQNQWEFRSHAHMIQSLNSYKQPIVWRGTLLDILEKKMVGELNPQLIIISLVNQCIITFWTNLSDPWNCHDSVRLDEILTNSSFWQPPFERFENQICGQKRSCFERTFIIGVLQKTVNGKRMKKQLLYSHKKLRRSGILIHG